jgi:NADPH:quinone reductase-like Zn-dependent oxidoreductase
MKAQQNMWIPLNIPKTQRAILQVDNGVLQVFDNVPLPHIPDDRMLVRVVAVALNPCDWKMPGQFPAKGVANGTDYAGIVVAIGPRVATLPSKPKWQVGDEVFGACHGANAIDPQSGAFAQYLRSDPELLFKKPPNMPWENAAAWGASGIATLGLSFFWDGGMGLSGSPDKPAKDSEQVLVYAGSTSIGTLAIQLLKK